LVAINVRAAAAVHLQRRQQNRSCVPPRERHPSAQHRASPTFPSSLTALRARESTSISSWTQFPKICRRPPLTAPTGSFKRASRTSSVTPLPSARLSAWLFSETS
jgi:hypothetical protein